MTSATPLRPSRTAVGVADPCRRRHVAPPRRARPPRRPAAPPQLAPPRCHPRACAPRGTPARHDPSLGRPPRAIAHPYDDDELAARRDPPISRGRGQRAECPAFDPFV